MNYHAYTEGFNWKGDSLNELREWANRLNREYNLAGKELKIWKNQGSTPGIFRHKGPVDKVIIFEAA